MSRSEPRCIQQSLPRRAVSRCSSVCKLLCMPGAGLPYCFRASGVYCTVGAKNNYQYYRGGSVLLV